MSNIESSERILYEFKNSIEILKQNWPDSIGQKYTLWCEQVLEKLMIMEQGRERIGERCNQIISICSAIENCDGDEPKKRARRR